MREILFRGKRIDNGEWVEGDFYQSKISGCYILQTIIKKSSKDGEIRIADKLVPYEVIPSTVGQFTGLTDKTGKRIFEGDLVVPVWVSPSGEIDGLDEDQKGEVIYKASSSFVLPKYERKYLLSDFVKREFIEYRSNVGEIYDYKDEVFLGEIIGNIHEEVAI